MTEEYKAALDKVMAVKKAVADGKAPINELKKAIAEARDVKERQRVIREADALVNLDIDEELGEILKRIREVRDPAHAYIIAYEHDGVVMVGAVGKGVTLEAMYYAISAQKPFADLKPLDDETRKYIKGFSEGEVS